MECRCFVVTLGKGGLKVGENKTMTPTYPDFEVTLIHTRNGLEFIRATIEGRLCNVHYAAAAYMAGEREPHYPVPVKLQTAWYSRIWQTKPNPFHSPRLYWDFIQGHFKLMGWLG